MKSVIDTLAPVFLVIAIGVILRWTRRLSDESLRGMSWLVFWVALPAMLFADVAGIDHPAAKAATDADYQHQLHIFLISVSGMVACIIAGYVVAGALKMPREKVGTFVQTAFRGNLAYIGLPVIQYAFISLAGEGAGVSARRDAALALAPLIMIYNVLAVIVLLAGQHQMSAKTLGRMARQIITNPLILACAAGLLWNAGGLTMPKSAANTLRIMGSTALPLALLTVGAAIATTRFTGQVLYTGLAVFLKSVFAPIVGYLVARLLHAAPRETFIALLLLACPTAVAAYVMAEHMKGDAHLAAQTVVVSTLLSIVGFAVVILLMS